jgi:hypothetical protein
MRPAVLKIRGHFLVLVADGEMLMWTLKEQSVDRIQMAQDRSQLWIVVKP